MVASGQGRSAWASFCLRVRSIVQEDEKVLQMDGGDGCTTQMYLMPLN